MPEFITAHPAVFAIAAYWIFSALVGGMPTPTAASSSGYQWLYNSLHILAGNLSAAVAAKYPQLPNSVLPPGSVQVTDTQQKTVTSTPSVTP